MRCRPAGRSTAPFVEFPYDPPGWTIDWAALEPLRIHMGTME
ncbi:hypothetical protein [Oscillochloris sp. ZM17-4]|nr:hypothetical protein [Oscillochloris sp. ZM17-4]